MKSFTTSQAELFITNLEPTLYLWLFIQMLKYTIVYLTWMSKDAYPSDFSMYCQTIIMKAFGCQKYLQFLYKRMQKLLQLSLDIAATLLLNIGTVVCFWETCIYLYACSPYLLNASTLLWIDGFVFPSQNNGLQRTYSIRLILQSINGRWSCYHCFCIPNISNKNLDNIQQYQLQDSWHEQLSEEPWKQLSFLIFMPQREPR